MTIEYRQGDATYPRLGPTERGVLAHVVNDRGGWGGKKSFVKALSARWAGPEAEYRRWFKDRVGEEGQPFALGQIQPVVVEPNLVVVNMLAQEGYSRASAPAIRYDALERCLEQVATLARVLEAAVYTVKIGTGLGGGSWQEVEPVLSRALSGLVVYVYSL